MMLKYMLDTNMVIYVIKRKPVELLDTFNAYEGLLCISTITHAEMLHGVAKSTQVQKNRSTYQNFTSRLDILDYGKKAAEHYGDIRAALEKQGKIIGVNDMHIAAHARSEGLIVVTNNLKEFQRVEGLRTDNWLTPDSTLA